MRWESKYDYLEHYGVKGQKHGLRRYQNEDGSLTAEGRDHYGVGDPRGPARGLPSKGSSSDAKKDYGDKGLIRKTIASEHGNYAFAKWRERRHNKNLKKAEASAGRHSKAIRDIDELLNSKDEKVSKNLTEKDREKLKAQRDKMEAQDNAARQKKIDKYQSKKDAQGAANRDLDNYRRHTKASTLILQNAALTIASSSFRHARARGEGVLSSLVESSTPIGPILRMMRDKKAYGKYIVYGEADDGDNFSVHFKE